MNKNYMLKNDMTIKTYNSIKDLPIIDYHCHLSPKGIYEDKPFSNIGEIWLASDHYKWKLMRTVGIDEKYITGNTSYLPRWQVRW